MAVTLRPDTPPPIQAEQRSTGETFTFAATLTVPGADPQPSLVSARLTILNQSQAETILSGETMTITDAAARTCSFALDGNVDTLYPGDYAAYVETTDGDGQGRRYPAAGQFYRIEVRGATRTYSLSALLAAQQAAAGSAATATTKAEQVTADAESVAADKTLTLGYRGEAQTAAGEAAVSESLATTRAASAQIAALASGRSLYFAADQTAQDALTPSNGDWVERTDQGIRFERVAGAWVAREQVAIISASSLVAAASRYGVPGAVLSVDGRAGGTFDYAASFAAAQGRYPWAALTTETVADAAGLTVDEAGGGKWVRRWDAEELLLAWCAALDGATNDRTALAAADDAAAAIGCPIVLGAGTARIAAGVTLDAPIRIKEGGLLLIETLVQFNSTVEAGPYRIFSSALANPVTFGRAQNNLEFRGAGGRTGSVWAEWFGAKGDGLTASAAANRLALQQMVSCTSGYRCIAVGGQYRVDDSINFPSLNIESSYDFGGGQIYYVGTAAPTKAVLNFESTNSRDCRFIHLSIHAGGAAGYALRARSTSGIFAIKDHVFDHCHFRGATVANVQLGDQSSSGLDLDGYNFLFDHCHWYGSTGTTNLIVDGDNVVNVGIEHCFMGSVNRLGGVGSNRPDYHIHFKNGACVNLSNCFLDRLEKWCIITDCGSLNLTDVDTEEADVLYVTANLDQASRAIRINSLRVADTSMVDNQFVIIAESGILEITSSYLGKGLTRARVRADEALHVTNVHFGGYRSANEARPAALVLAKPHRCSYDGVPLGLWRPPSANPYLELWSGSGTDDLPFGYIKSGVGTCTITRDGGGSGSSVGRSTFGRYTAKVAVTSGAVSGQSFDGLQLRHPWQGINPDEAVSVIVTGYADLSTFSGATAPKVSIEAFGWGGSSHDFIAGRSRDCSIDAYGRFVGITNLTRLGSYLKEASYIRAGVGLGVAAASGTFYVDTLMVVAGQAEDYVNASESPEYSKLYSLLPIAHDVVDRGTFSLASRWTVGTGWTMTEGVESGGVYTPGYVTHAAGNTAALSQRIGSGWRYKRANVCVTASSVTAGSLVVKVGGTTFGTITASGTFDYQGLIGITGDLISFEPSSDFAGQIANVKLYAHRGGQPIISGEDYARAGVLVSAPGGLLLSGSVQDTTPNRIEFAAAKPTTGTYRAGDRVINNSPTVDGSNMVVTEWARVTNGSGHVLGTDWRALYASTVSPAT